MPVRLAPQAATVSVSEVLLFWRIFLPQPSKKSRKNVENRRIKYLQFLDVIFFALDAAELGSRSKSLCDLLFCTYNK
jgi:hypothetical protein